MRIQELADATGLTTHTIRFYEKEGLLDSRHVRRDGNNYRKYADAAVERLQLIKKFQGVGCSLAELKVVLKDQDAHTRTDDEIITWIRQKMREIEDRKGGLDQMLGTLNWMLEYRIALRNDPEKAKDMEKRVQLH